MDFFDVVEKRRSIRSFKDRPVEDEKLQIILEVANSAPSAGNLQCYDIVAVTDEKKRSRLAAACHGQSFVAQAPLCLVFLADCARCAKQYGKRGSTLYAIQDANIAASYAQLAIAALGLGSVWVGSFDEWEVAGAVDAPEGRMPVVVMPVGYAAKEPEPTPRRDVSDLVKKESY
jgi:nitroreductase